MGLGHPKCSQVWVPGGRPCRPDRAGGGSLLLGAFSAPPGARVVRSPGGCREARPGFPALVSPQRGEGEEVPFVRMDDRSLFLGVGPRFTRFRAQKWLPMGSAGAGLLAAQAPASTLWSAGRRRRPPGASRCAEGSPPSSGCAEKGRQSSISPKATFQWNEHSPLRSQARRVHPGQAQSSLPAWPWTTRTCSQQMWPAQAGCPQGFR